MIRILMGSKGAGKTKALIDLIQSATKEENGDVVCINKGNRFMYDISHSVRLIDTEQFEIVDYTFLSGFICGVISENFDVTHIFIDSIMKIIPDSIGSIDDFITKLESFSEKFNIKFTLTISADNKFATEKIKKYLVNF